MKTKGRWLMASAAAPLILSSAAAADFVGLETVNKSIGGFEEWVCLVVNLYANFSDDDGDGIGDGAMLAVGGLPGLEANISVSDGVFYQNPLNSNSAGRTAPPEAFLDSFPSLRVDTFLTVGLKFVPTGAVDTTNLTPTFPLEGSQPGNNPAGSWTDTRLQINDGAWFTFNPNSDQARPGNFDNPDTQVLIGQFTVAAGAGPNADVFGTVLVEGAQADGSIFLEYHSFGGVLLCDNGVPDPGENCDNCPQDIQCPPGTRCVDFMCEALCGNGVVNPGEDCENCPADVMCPPGTECVAGMCEALCGNGVVDPGEDCQNCPQDVTCPPGTVCVDGVCGQIPCPWDLNGNGIVDGIDVALLLASWGLCDGECPADFDGDGEVGPLDLLIMLVDNLGACPGKCPWDLDGNGFVWVPDLTLLIENGGPCDDPENCPWDLNADGFVGVFDLVDLLLNLGPCPF